eukprot:m.104223 g.104223  ORF g.104223 m.104223 type:complete len:676 (-) comp13257_c1_seq1:314-2341(-)
MTTRATVGLAALLERRRQLTHQPCAKPNTPNYEQWTNDHGHFQPTPELPLLEDRYQFVRILGRGEFAVLLQAKDTMDPRNTQVAIKVLNAGYDALGEHEMRQLHSLNAMDPTGSCHIVRLKRHFWFGSHFCLVCELLSTTPIKHAIEAVIRQSALDTAPKGCGVSSVEGAQRAKANIKPLREVAFQLLCALKLLRMCRLIHADVKPDNILLTPGSPSSFTVPVTLVDFGNAVPCTQDAIGAYLDTFEIQTMLYRAPEVFLGLHIGPEMDVWSVGCIVAELALGRPVVDGQTQLDVLKSIHDLVGPFPHCYRQGALYQQFSSCIPTLVASVTDSDAASTGLFKLASRLHDQLELSDATFAHFLAGLLHPDPDVRFSPSTALAHPFFAPLVPVQLLQAPEPHIPEFPSQRSHPVGRFLPMHSLDSRSRSNLPGPHSSTSIYAHWSPAEACTSSETGAATCNAALLPPEERCASTVAVRRSQGQLHKEGGKPYVGPKSGSVHQKTVDPKVENTTLSPTRAHFLQSKRKSEPMNISTAQYSSVHQAPSKSKSKVQATKPKAALSLPKAMSHDKKVLVRKQQPFRVQGESAQGQGGQRRTSASMPVRVQDLDEDTTDDDDDADPIASPSKHQQHRSPTLYKRPVASTQRRPSPKRSYKMVTSIPESSDEDDDAVDGLIES